jgi:hypothetical protein
MSATNSLETVNRMLRDAKGGAGTLEDADVVAIRHGGVEICKLCSNAGNVAAAAKETKRTSAWSA